MVRKGDREREIERERERNGEARKNETESWLVGEGACAVFVLFM